MHYNYSPPLLRYVRLSLIALCVSLALLLTCVASAFAASVNIYDNAGVLNSGQVRSQASKLQYPIDIYTTDVFTGSRTSFGQQADGKMRGNSLILAVDTVNKYIWVNGSKGVPLSRTQYQDAANSFASEFKSSSSYTNATNSAVRSLQGSLVNATNTSRERGVGAAPVSGGGFNFGGTACCIGLLVLAALAIFGVMRLRRGGSTGGFGSFGGFRGFNGFRRNPPPEGPYGQYGQPYNQGQGNYPPPGYGPGYPPPGYGPGYPQQGQGMNPLAAGGLGAAAGGLLGYELGKNAGERDDQGNVGSDQGSNYGGGGADFGGGDYGGGGAGADFGGGDYGGGGGDYGGGGAGADFGGGGGGDYGGGGAGADFGGGGGGDYGDSGGSGSDF